MNPPFHFPSILGVLFATAGLALAEPDTVKELKRQLGGAQTQVEELSSLMLELKREMKSQSDDVRLMREKALKVTADSKKQQLASETKLQAMQKQLQASEAKIAELESQLAATKAELAAAKSGSETPRTTLLTARSITIPPVFFGLSDKELQRQYLRVLSAVQGILVNAPKTVFRLTGHANQEGNEDVNFRQSAIRAESLATFLTGRGIPRKSLQVVAAGSAHPLHTADSPAGRRENRRVEIEILP